MLVLGGVIYGKVWWDGPSMSLRFTKWYFLIWGLLSVAAAIYTYFWL